MNRLNKTTENALLRDIQRKSQCAGVTPFSVYTDSLGNKIFTINPFVSWASLHASYEQAPASMARYFAQLVEEEGLEKGCYLLLPPLVNLARFFGTSLADMRKAFWELRKHGYDCTIPGDYGHICIFARDVP